MKHVAFLTAIIALLSWGINLLLPWWSIGIVAFVVGLLFNVRSILSFLSGFLGVFTLWFAVAYYLNDLNNGILSTKIATLIQLPGPEVLLLLTAIIGGVSAGLACLSGNLLRKSL